MFDCMTYFSDHRKLPSWLGKARENSRYWSSDQFFVNLREFTSNADLAVSGNLPEIPQRRHQTMRSFVENDCTANCSSPLKPLFSVF